ncbi:MAG: hypothetical protein STSR0008_22040 [Ignavibacterium sp.]
MKKYSANYSHSNHNFVIQNLRGEKVTNEYLAGICILKNILQRGKPTLLSKYLQTQIGAIHKNNEFIKPYALIDAELPKWERIIRGDVKGNYYPAKKFYEELIPKYLPDYVFIQSLILPEISINEITQVPVDEFKNQQVDFYLPQAFLVIEIDGGQHRDSLNDDKRDRHLSKYGIMTVRITTTELESENEAFQNKVKSISKRIEKIIIRENELKEKDATFISLENYKKVYQQGIDTTNPIYVATAIMRVQILILSLLENGKLDFHNDWKIEVLERDVKNFADKAIEDLFLWFEHIYKLQKVSFTKPKYFIRSIKSTDEYSNDSQIIKVDFSLLKRYTDEFQTKSEIIFVRTDYLDRYLYFKKGNGSNLFFHSFLDYDYFSISTTTPIKYNLKFGHNNSDSQSLLFLLNNIFLQETNNLTFNEGQLPIIANALARKDTIGLLPTGSGKSVCYQLATILQPAISFVVCPIKSLMYDQKAELDIVYFSRINHITSDDDGEDKERIQNEFASGKYFFIFISPERFQVKSFREYFITVTKSYSIAYAIIDEVHCLSEWGHDFRTAYLNLANTIQRLCSNINFIGLTATASINVIKDIQIEFGISQENVKTLIDYSRKELEFIVINDNNNKEAILLQTLSKLQERFYVFEVQSHYTKCGIIFTPTVNGKKGCYLLSLKLKNYFQKDVRYFSGTIPKINKKPIMTDQEYDDQKKITQDDFKKNKFPLLTATKAFGMGINKGNIHYTFHYGIPSSMEALYQEAGRAGRDKHIFSQLNALCFVLLTKTNDSEILNEIWDRKTTLSRIHALQKKIKGDVNTNIFLFLTSLKVIKDEFKLIKNLHFSYSIPNKKGVVIDGKNLDSKKSILEKAIYRLNQLGIVEDWTIDNFFGGGVFTVDYTNYSDESIKQSLLKTINKYDSDFSLSAIESEEKYSNYKKILNAPEGYSEIDKYILILLQWSYDNFAYNRRQSLKNIYENSCALVDGIITKEEFKLRLENYFKFTESSFILQHIANNPNDFEKWFEVFYQIKNNTVSNELITKRQQESLRDNLSRFLESYMYNTGLDLVSGLLRLLLDDFDNIDGKNRFESSVGQIKKYSEENIELIISNILNVGKSLNNKNKNNLARTLHKFFPSTQMLHKIYKQLEDEHSLTIILDISNKELRKINKRISDGFRKTG